MTWLCGGSELQTFLSTHRFATFFSPSFSPQEEDVDLIVLARYMQIFSRDFCERHWQHTISEPRRAARCAVATAWGARGGAGAPAAGSSRCCAAPLQRAGAPTCPTLAPLI